MIATRRYWSSIMSSIGMLSLFLVGFIIFGLLMVTLIPGRNAYTGYQVPSYQTHTYSVPYNTSTPVISQIAINHTVQINVFAPNGTFIGTEPEIVTTFSNVTTFETVTNFNNVTNSTVSYAWNCTGGSCYWWVARLGLLFGVIALSLFILAFALASYGVACEESMFLRDGFAQNGNMAYINNGGNFGGNLGNNGLMYGTTALQVVNAPWYAIGSIASAVIALWFLFAAVLIAFDYAVGRHSHHWIAAVVILGFFGFVAGLFLLYMLFRSERAIAVQPVYAGVPVVKEERVVVQPYQSGAPRV